MRNKLKNIMIIILGAFLVLGTIYYCFFQREKIELKVGEYINLSNACKVEDDNVALINENKLIALKSGKTKIDCKKDKYVLLSRSNNLMKISLRVGNSIEIKDIMNDDKNYKVIFPSNGVATYTNNKIMALSEGNVNFGIFSDEDKVLVVSLTVSSFNSSKASINVSNYQELKIADNNFYFNNSQFIEKNVSNDGTYYTGSNANDYVQSADPYIYYENGVYYLFSTYTDKGIAYFTSNDLKSWTYHGLAFNKKSNSIFTNYNSFWAPEVYKYNNQYYLLYTGGYSGNKWDLKLYMAVSDSIGGPYKYYTSYSNLNNESKLVLDGSLLFDNNQVYLYYHVGSENGGGIKGVKLSSDLKQTVGQSKTLINPASSGWENQNKQELPLNEGVSVLSYNGKYYLMYSANEYYEKTYAIGYAVSGSPLGSYTKKTLKTPLVVGDGVGHNSYFSLNNNDYYIVYHKNVYNNDGSYKTRKLGIDSISFLDNGDLYVNGPSSVNQPLPFGMNQLRKMSSDDYNVKLGNVQYHFSELSDGITGLNSSAKNNISFREINTNDLLEIDFLRDADVKDIWLYSDVINSNKNLSYHLIINDKYIVKENTFYLGISNKIQIPDLPNGELIKNIKINFLESNIKIKLYEVQAVELNKNEYEVSLDFSGGNSCNPSTKRVVLNENYGFFCSPSKIGYNFLGWYTQKNGGELVNSSTKVNLSSNHSLFAHWSKKNYLLDINSDDNKYGDNYSSGSHIQSFDVKVVSEDGKTLDEKKNVSDYYSSKGEYNSTYYIRNIKYRDGYSYNGYALSDDSVSVVRANSKEIVFKQTTDKNVKISINTVYDKEFLKSGKLKIKDGKVVDKNNKTYIIKGVAMNYAVNSKSTLDFSSSAIKEIKTKMGANTIRVNTWPEIKKEDAFSYMDSLVESAYNNGMYVIINWGIWGGNPLTYKAKAIDFFVSAAKRYSKYGNVMYEICNEVSGSDGTWGNVKKYANEVIPKIRKYDKTGIIIVGTPEFCSRLDYPMKDPIKGYSNIAYTVHRYVDWGENGIKIAKQAFKSKLPVICTEFAALDGDPGKKYDFANANQWISLLNEYDIGRVCWCLIDRNEYSLINPNSSRNGDWKDSNFTKHGRWLVKLYTGREIPVLKQVDLKRVYNTRSGLLISWAPNSNIDGYYLYRKTKSSKWKKIATLKGANVSRYEDKNVVDKTKYTYTVKAYKGADVGFYDKKGLSCVKRFNYIFDINPDNNQYGVTYEKGAHIRSFDVKIVSPDNKELNSQKNTSDYYNNKGYYNSIYYITNIKYRTGYQYNGYSLSNKSVTVVSANSKEIVLRQNVNEDITLSINTKLATYKVTMNANGGKEKNYKSSWIATYGKTYNLSSYVPVRSGYNFLGWYTAKEGGKKISDKWKCTGDSNYVFYAHWKKKK